MAKKLCSTCKFSWRSQGEETMCNYMEIFGHSRGCDPKNCIKYKRGKRIVKPPTVRTGSGLLRWQKANREKYEVTKNEQSNNDGTSDQRSGNTI